MTEKNLIPLLRFPKFVRDAEWICTTLRAEMDYENGVAHENDIDSLGKYIVVNSKFISTEGQIEKRSNNAHCLAEENDILMVLSDLPNGKAIAKCFYVDASNKYTVNQRICKLRSKGANSKLLYYLLNRNPYFLSFDDGVKQTNLKKDEVLSCPLIIPKSIEEQQKIAECLSSIDSYISSINEKIEQLKAHKKGLMQKLFPQNGKTIPEYRFPEFEKDGAWVEIKVSDIFEITRGHVLAASNTKSAPDDEYRYPVFSSQTAKNGLMGYYNKPLYTDAITWTTDGANAGTVNYREGPFYCTNVCGVLLSNKGYANKCIAELLSMEAKKHVSYVGNPKLMNNVMAEIKLYIPSIREQHRIASCLSSIDMLRQVNTEKRVQLEKIKKGLVQHLFPQI